MRLSQLQEARYAPTSDSVVNRALEAVRELRNSDEQVFLAKFKGGDPDEFFDTLKELQDRFGQPEWRYLSSEAKQKHPFWVIEPGVELLLHYSGISVIVE